MGEIWVMNEPEKEWIDGGGSGDGEWVMMVSDECMGRRTNK